jgi:hypothetical protein
VLRTGQLDVAYTTAVWGGGRGAIGARGGRRTVTHTSRCTVVFESVEAVGGLGASALRWLGMVTPCCSLVCSQQYQLLMSDERVMMMMMHGACAMRDA